MSLIHFIHSLFGIDIRAPDSEVASERGRWRKAVHDNRNLQQLSIGSAMVATRISDEARQKFNETIKLQEEDTNLRRIEKAFLERMRGN